MSPRKIMHAMRAIALLLYSTVALALTVTSANAAGTLFDTLVSNTVTVNFSIGGTSQTAVTATETFKVDRMVDVQVSGTNRDVSPNESSTTAVLTFEVENQGNASQGYALDVFTGTADFALTPSTDAAITSGEYGLFIDVDNSGTYNSGDTFYNTAGTLNAFDLSPDAKRKIFVVAHIPENTTNGQNADFVVEATTLNSGTAVGSAGTVTTETATPDIDTTDTVFVDAAGISSNNDIAEDGQHSDDATFTVKSADLTVSKAVRVINRTGDNCLTAPPVAADEQFAIPGSCIEYTIVLKNKGSVSAESLAISDPLPSQIAFEGFHSSTSGDFSDLQPGDSAPAHSAGTVTATEQDLGVGAEIKLVIRALIN